MGLDTSALVYLPNFDVWARPVMFHPIASQPGAGSYALRGIYGTRPIAIPGSDGTLISSAETILDIRDIEFAVMPRQRDRLTIPRDGNMPALGEFEVTDAQGNGGGETTLVLQEVVTPPGPAHGRPAQ